MKKLYVLIRSDLPRNYQAVQAGHAVAEWCKQESARYHWNGRDIVSLPWRWYNGTLVYLKVDDEQMLRSLFDAASEAKAAFFEPDINNEMTAFAVLDSAGTYDYLKLL